MTAAERPGAAAFAAALAALGYEELWTNDTRRGDGLATLAAMAPGSPAIPLAVGVVALSEHPASRVAERVRATGLGPDQLVVGVGSGSSASLQLVRESVAALRRLLPHYAIAVSAVGPRMARLAGEVADAVVANWALPDGLAELAALAAEGAAEAGRPRPRVVAYVRTAVGDGSAERLRDEMTRYAQYGRHYDRALAGAGGRVVGVALESPDSGAMGSALEPYRSVVDTLVVRGVPARDTVEDWLEIARAAAPSPGSG